jgi:hypothetical protein
VALNRKNSVEAKTPIVSNTDSGVKYDIEPPTLIAIAAVKINNNK